MNVPSGSASAALALGTANWGAVYGAPGREAQVEAATAAAIARRFTASGHDLVDTAPAYGRAESLIGEVFAGTSARIMTKIPSAILAAPREDRVRRALASLSNSARVTRVEQFDGVLLHDAPAALADALGTRSLLLQIRESGRAIRVGVSVYTLDEAHAAVELLGADLLQVPCNVLDQRFLGPGGIADLVSRGVEVHVRSIFLNGTLLADPAQLSGPLCPLANPVARVHQEAQQRGLTPLEAAVHFARDVTGANAVVIGAYSDDQLQEILQAWDRPTSEGPSDWADLAVSDTVIDPRTWVR